MGKSDMQWWLRHRGVDRLEAGSGAAMRHRVWRRERKIDKTKREELKL